jgi:alpha-ribazole phosphatase
MSQVTRWWWVRHAPVVGMEGRIYGSDDVPCDTSDTASFQALASVLPGDAVWLTSHLSRARDTAQAIADAGLSYPEPIVEEHLGEQDFGDWQGHTWDQMKEMGADIYESFWQLPARNAPPGGESFADQIARTAAVIDRVTEDNGGRDIVAVAHGGTIRAAITHALGLDPEGGMSFNLSNLSVTRLEHVAEGLLRGRGGCWRVISVNHPPLGL